MSAKFEYKKIIAGSDCDPNLSLSIGGAMRLLADCEHMQIHNDKFVNDYLTSKNYAWFLIARNIEIVYLPKFLDAVNVVTAMYEINTMTGNRNTFIYDKDGKALVKSNAFGALVDIKKGQAVRSNAFREYKLAEFLGCEPMPRKIEYDITMGQKVDSVTTPKYFLDHYVHVNNANYAVLASEYLGRKFDKGTMRIEHKNAAAAGDRIDIFVYDGTDRTIVDMRATDGKSYCLVEFGK